ncbi:MAG: tRNA threonylcarbamoyladenosine dehydratase [Bacteroidales bacterium]|nr:tRNA threonylcarbamoyladenosine dehydratase [Bacteroidales bacterium]
MYSPADDPVFNRTTLLLGRDVMERLGSVRVILFGVGGVGSWCAEGLVRSGISHLTLVDSDCVSTSNINRQLMATMHTVGKVKVEALRDRLLEINPNAEITAIQRAYNAETADSFEMESYDYILDAIDSLKEKSDLILRGTRTQAVFFSSMGAACKVDPQGVKVAEFWNVRGCPLAAAIRKKFKQNHTWPGHKYRCVYGEEVLPNRGTAQAADASNSEWDGRKVQINGTTAHITALFGMTLAGLVVEDVYDKVLSPTPDTPAKI